MVALLKVQAKDDPSFGNDLFGAGLLEPSADRRKNG